MRRKTEEEPDEGAGIPHVRTPAIRAEGAAAKLFATNTNFPTVSVLHEGHEPAGIGVKKKEKEKKIIRPPCYLLYLTASHLMSPNAKM